VRPGRCAIYTVSRSGDEPALLVDDAEDPAISPDGTQVAFARRDASGDTRIVVAPLWDVSRDHTLTTGNGDGAWDHREPAWSPEDGSEICYRAHRGLWVVPAAGGRARLVTDETSRDLNPFWSRDGRFIYFTSKREGALAFWQVPARGGRLRRLTPGTGPERQGSLSRDGRLLAFSTLLPNPDLVLMDLSTRKETAVSNESEDICPVFGSGGVFFVSNRSGTHDLWFLPWAAPAITGEAVRVPGQAMNAQHPAVSPDGKWVAYYAVDAQNTRDIWVAPASGGSPVRFTTEKADDLHPAWSPDGTKIAFASERTGGYSIWVGRVAEGKAVGEPWRVTVGTSTSRDQAPAWLPDGLRIAYITQGSEGDWEVRIAAADGRGTPARLPATRGARRVCWGGLERLLVSGLFDEPVVSLRAFDAATFSPLPLDPPIVFGESGELVDFDVSRGWLVFSRDEPRRGQIWVYEARRPL
jgi:TolB protein